MTSTAIAPAPALTGDELAHAVTILFSGAPAAAAPAGSLSPHAAYQDALYARAILVDLRPAPARALDGEVPADLAPLHLHGEDPLDVATLQRIAQDSEVVLVSSDGVLAERITSHLHRLGLPWVSFVRGGFGAWCRAGLPAVNM